MAPKKARVTMVGGVHCSHNVASGIVIVGSGLVGHDRRDCFKLKAVAGSTLEEQVLARPKFAALAAVASAAASSEKDGSEAPRHEEFPMPDAAATTHEQEQPTAVLFGGSRQLPSQRESFALHALIPHRLESDLGVAWEFTTAEKRLAEHDSEEQRKAAQRERIEAQREKERLREAGRKRTREATEPACEPCLCTRAGAVELLHESQKQTRDVLEIARAAVDASRKAQSKLDEWVQRAKA